MIGSTFVAAENSEELNQLQIDDLDSLRHVSLGSLVTLDFESALKGSGMKWALGTPLTFDEEAGIAIFQVNSKALEAVTGAGSSLADSHPEDIALLKQFIRESESLNFYEIATF